MLSYSMKIGIEFDGMYWHSSCAGMADGHLLAKTMMCKSKGVSLVHVFEDEWDAKREQCKAMLKQIVSPSGVLDLSSACVKAISRSDAQRFFGKNSHDLFAKPSKHNFAVVNGSKMLSCISLSVFSGKVLVTSMCNSTSICTTSTYKMLMQFIESTFMPEHNVQVAQARVDNRWPIGNVMHELGFTELKQTMPSRWLIDIHAGWKRKCRGVNAKTLSQYG